MTLTTHVGARVAALEAVELEEIYLLREQLEPLALARSIPLLSDEQRKRLRSYVEGMEQTADVDNPSRWVELDRRFHLASFEAAELPRVLKLIDDFWNQTQQYRRAYAMLRGSFDVAHAEHRLLLEAIDLGDAGIAETIARTHIRRTRLALGYHPELFLTK